MSVEDWVNENCERVQQLRDDASVGYHSTSAKRKEKRDKTCQFKEFQVGQKVWYRTPGLNETVQSAWQGPYLIDKVLGGL